MITRTMSPSALRREMEKDLSENIIPYLRRNYDNKVRRAIIKSTRLPMIFNPIHYFSKTANNDWYIFYYAMNKRCAQDPTCLAVSEVQTEEGTYVYEYVVAGDHKIYIFPPHFFSRYRSRFLKDENISRREMVDRYIKSSYSGIAIALGMGHEKCAISFQDGYAIGDIISREEGIYIFKTFISKELLRKDQRFATVYDQALEQKLLEQIINLEDPHDYLLDKYSDLVLSNL